MTLLDWLKTHWEFFAGAIASAVTALLGLWMAVSRKLDRFRAMERFIFGDDDAGIQGAEKRMRQLEDANISIEEKLDQIPAIAQSTQENGKLLARIAGKLELD